MNSSESLRSLVLKYVQTVLIQVSHSALSYAHHSLEARLARWLLMCADRIDESDIPLTHEFMAAMIESQRTSVTMTLHELEAVDAIRSRRGIVVIHDRARLEELAGDSYGAPEAAYRRLFGKADALNGATGDKTRKLV